MLASAGIDGRDGAEEQGSRMNGAELLVAALKNEGVKQIFGLPGEENLVMVEALRRSSIKLVVTRHEQAAAFMAATHGRLTGEPGVCLTTLGPGALNLTTGAVSGGGCRLDDDAVDQDGPPDRQPYDDPSLGAGGIPGCAAGAAWSGASRAARGHRGRTGGGTTAYPAAPDRGARRPDCGARSCGRAHPESRAATHHAWCGSEPPVPRRRLVGFHQARGDSVLQHADG